MKLRDKDYLAVKEFKKAITTFLGGKLFSLVLFGSKAKGTDSSDSDIDIFIVVKKYNSLVKREIIDTAFDVNLAYGVYISPRIISLELFNNPLFFSTPFIQHIKKEGVKL
ncbi:MAG: nucleotidyltransferase domain-containing protein [Candidatus Omnitrophica bacterium]|nr:nucleotidyltransferase domain-containing protein [Candidatus Omnitrophota bacterium]MBU0896706.1 nucleotidyltransferase domain-containing protein [Candidatus Omnitrophota bacterium]MBU1367362.1 nucleotidyltransferase domain-containing protein [Candidatus Omnitrophota bacterium]MBU1811023.1 nucleotidyltransferase domain-containing protein [Candidatus Omnitrophota bacterium]